MNGTIDHEKLVKIIQIQATRFLHISRRSMYMSYLFTVLEIS